MVHVCYALYDATGNFSKYVGASMRSVFANTQEQVTVHLLHDKTLSEQNKQRFAALADENGAKIVFYDIVAPPHLYEYMKTKKFSPATFYRLMLGSLIKEKIGRIIYLDADIIVDLDINELYTFDMRGKTLAAVPDMGMRRFAGIESVADGQASNLIIGGYIKAEKYFNAGVLLIDMDKFAARENFFDECMKLWQDNLQFLTFYDNDILNWMFKDDYEPLPQKFNVVVNLQENSTGGAIYHYAGKTWGIDEQVYTDRIFFAALVKTPWFNAEVFMRGLNFARYLRDWEAQRREDLYRLMQRYHRLIFWGEARWEAAARAAVTFTHLDRYVCVPPPVSPDLWEVSGVAKLCKEKDADTLVIVMMNIYGNICGMLVSMGFKENVDFADGRMLVPSSLGSKPWSDYEILQNL